MSDHTKSVLVHTLDRALGRAIEGMIGLLVVVTVGAPAVLLAFGLGVGLIGW